MSKRLVLAVFLFLCMAAFVGSAQAATWYIPTDDFVTVKDLYIADDDQHVLSSYQGLDAGSEDLDDYGSVEKTAFMRFDLSSLATQGIAFDDINSIQLSARDTTSDCPDLYVCSLASDPGTLSSANPLTLLDSIIRPTSGADADILAGEYARGLTFFEEVKGKFSAGLSFITLALVDTNPGAFRDLAMLGDPLLTVTYGQGTGTGPVPEPATLVLLGLGSVGVLGLRRKMKK